MPWYHRGVSTPAVSREHLIHALYEAAELEHTLMCTYLYAAFSLREGIEEGLTPEQAPIVASWGRSLLGVAIEEMGHLTAVWNITSALGGSPRFGRGNFPLDPGTLPAGIVVKLAPFGEAALQHFIHLERPAESNEPEGEGFAPELLFQRGVHAARLTPMAVDYETVGNFYAKLSSDLSSFVSEHGESAVFAGDPKLQIGSDLVALPGARPVLCAKTALAAFTAIVEQGEGAPQHATDSHFQRFAKVRDELRALKAKDPNFSPAFPAATNPVLRRPMRSEGRVWLEDETAARTVDLANTGYAVMLRLLAHSYLIPSPAPEKALVVDLSLGLMRAVTALGKRAARLPAGPSNPGCNAGMSFTALRDAAPLPPGPAATRFFVERFEEMAEAARALEAPNDARTHYANRQLQDLAARAKREFARAALAPVAPIVAASATAASSAPAAAVSTIAASSALAAAPNDTPPTPVRNGAVDEIPGQSLTLLYEGKRCIHARFCVTGAPGVFLANVKGPWIRPDAIPAERLMEIAHACPSGAIRYQRKDGGPEEAVPPVNLLAIREAGPYAVRGELLIDGEAAGYRATLCRCGASKNKPYCDGSHHDVAFTATGEPASGSTDMLQVRGGPLRVDPQLDGPLQVRGNLEITSGTGRVVARLQQARLCRCGGSANKPYCDGTHARIGFKSDNPPSPEGGTP